MANNKLSKVHIQTLMHQILSCFYSTFGLMFTKSCGFPFQQITMSGCRVFIGHLSPHARERDVEKFFKGYGRIREINLKNGFGFVVSVIDHLVHLG